MNDMSIDGTKDTLRGVIEQFGETCKFTVFYGGNITRYECKQELFMDCQFILDDKVSRVTILYGYDTDIIRVRIHMLNDL